MDALIVGIVVAGFLAALFLLARTVTAALELTTRGHDESVAAVAEAVTSAAGAVGEAVAKALAPPPIIKAEEPEPLADWADETGAMDQDFDDGYGAMEVPEGPATMLGRWEDREARDAE